MKTRFFLVMVCAALVSAVVARAQNAPVPMGTPVAGEWMMATALHGSVLEPQFSHLMHLREEHLMQTATGRLLVEYYDRHSPRVAEYMANHEPARRLVQLLLAPLVVLVAYPFLLGLMALAWLSWLELRNLPQPAAWWHRRVLARSLTSSPAGQH